MRLSAIVTLALLLTWNATTSAEVDGCSEIVGYRRQDPAFPCNADTPGHENLADKKERAPSGQFVECKGDGNSLCSQMGAGKVGLPLMMQNTGSSSSAATHDGDASGNER